MSAAQTVRIYCLEYPADPRDTMWGVIIEDETGEGPVIWCESQRAATDLMQTMWRASEPRLTIGEMAKDRMEP